jgi:hypothetical protein
VFDGKKCKKAAKKGETSNFDIVNSRAMLAYLVHHSASLSFQFHVKVVSKPDNSRHLLLILVLFFSSDAFE